MSDFKLRDELTGDEVDDVDGLRAELVRLRKDNDEMRNGPEGTEVRVRLSETRAELILAHRNLRDQEEELERLRDRASTMKSWAEDFKAERDGLVVKLERLREEVQTNAQAFQDWKAAADERDRLLGENRAQGNVMAALEQKLQEAEVELERLREALHAIQHELGVPDVSYPAPVANAYMIAGAALGEEA